MSVGDRGVGGAIDTDGQLMVAAHCPAAMQCSLNKVHIHALLTAALHHLHAIDN